MISLLLVLASPVADTVRLGPGIHPGPLVLSRQTVLLGAPGAVLRGTGQGSVLVINASGCIVRGLRIEGSGRNPDGPDAAVLVRGDSATLEDIVIRDMLFGVYLLESDGTVLRRLDILGPGGFAEGARGDGIYLYHSRSVRAEDNTIRSVRDGIYFSYSDSARMSGNRVSHVRFGLHYMFSHHNQFVRNVFTDNAAGAVLMNSNGVRVTDNVFAWNSGSRSYGLVLQTATNPVVQDNSFVGNGIGVFFDNVIAGDFQRNVIAGNWLGLELFPNSERTRITSNTLLGNTFDAVGGRAAGAFRLCVEGRGNYWAAATGAGAGRSYDLDGDGVLDAPHAASSPLAELALRRGSLRLFLGSPAARTLEWAERTFPVFDLAQVTDSCPLAATPTTRALSSLPDSLAGCTGGPIGQAAVATAVLTFGTLWLVFTARRRRWRLA